MSGPALAASSDKESVGSCSGPPTPHTPPAPSAPRGGPVRRQLDFSGGGDLEDDDEFLCRVADDIERGYTEAKRRASSCVCGRGMCAVERDGRSGRWKYVCPSRPKCSHVAFYEEVDPSLQTQPVSRSHPEPSNPCTFNDPSNPIAGPSTPVNVRAQVADTTTPVIIRPPAAGATGVTTPENRSGHGEGAVTPANDGPQGVDTATPAKFVPQSAGASANMPAKFIPQGAVVTTPAKVSPHVTTPAKVSPQGNKTNDTPICQCRAGKCRKSRIGEEDWYVCPIQKGKGACSYRVLASDFVKDMVPSAQLTPCDEVRLGSPSMLHRPIPAVNTPAKSPISKDTCFLCKETGHWKKDCPRLSRKDGPCF